MRSTMRRRAGVVGDAPSVSAAITAYPSIADRAKGGTSMRETTSALAIRPLASARLTHSVRAIGRMAPASRWRASSREIVEVKGRIEAPLARVIVTRANGLDG